MSFKINFTITGILPFFSISMYYHIVNTKMKGMVIAMANKTVQKFCLLGAAAVLLLCILLKSWDSGAAAVTPNTALIRCNADTAPSVMYGDGPQMKMWWSSNTNGSGIYYTANQDTPIKVLEASASGWDSFRICNPSVIKGSFYTNGQAYTYAMYYTGIAEEDENSSHIGAAFSNNGIDWDKYAENPVISSDNIDTDHFGVGLPSVCISAGGQITMLYFDSAAGKYYTAVSADGINFTEKTPLENPPEDENSTDIAYSQTEGKWYITTQSNTSAEIHIYETVGSSLANAWKQKATLPQTASDKQKNQSPRWMRYPNGAIYVEPDSGYQYIYHGNTQNSARSVYTASWEFTANGDRQGWEAINITKDTGPVEGFWTFITNKENPHLLSPAIELPASSYSTVAVRIANQNTDSAGKIYFKTAAEDFYSEDKSVSFTCTAGGGWYTHHVCMAANEKWSGTITGIRVDPVFEGTVAACGIDFIRVIE